jgi:alanine racemase
MSHSPYREAVINLKAVRANVTQLKEKTGTPNLMIVVKANAYGHGMVEVARAALAGGANWLGVADIDEALALRRSGIEAPILAWIHAPDETFVEALAADITVGVSSIAQLRACADAALAQTRLAPPLPARVHLKLETGLSRNGASEPEWPDFFAQAVALEAQGGIVVEGIFSHLSNTSEADDLAQGELFDRGVLAARSAGLAPRLVHLTASATALTQPTLRYNMVRIGILAYGVSPVPGRTAADLGLTPVMTLRARVIAVRRVPADKGVSYDYTYRTERETTLALIPLGYGEGIPRAASGRGPVVLARQSFTIAGRVAMDQFIVDVGDTAVAVGDEAVLFGDPEQGHPSVAQWADAASTIGYEMVTRMGGRVQRTFVGLD